MEKKELVRVLSEKLGVYQYEVERFLDAFIDVTRLLLVEGDEIRLPRLGKLHMVKLPAQIVPDNLHGSVPVHLPERMVVKFTPFDSFHYDVKDPRVDVLEERA